MVPVGTGRAQGGLTHTAPVRNGFPAFVGAVGVPTIFTIGLLWKTRPLTRRS